MKNSEKKQIIGARVIIWLAVVAVAAFCGTMVGKILTTF